MAKSQSIWFGVKTFYILCKLQNIELCSFLLFPCSKCKLVETTFYLVSIQDSVIVYNSFCVLVSKKKLGSFISSFFVWGCTGAAWLSVPPFFLGWIFLFLEWKEIENQGPSTLRRKNLGKSTQEKVYDPKFMVSIGW